MSEVPEKPDAAAPETSAPKRRFRFGCLGVCGCTFLLLVFAWVGVELWMRHVLNSEIAALHAAGEPVTWEEVIADIEPIPDVENAALVLQPHLNDIAAWVAGPSARIGAYSRDLPLGTRPSDEMLKHLRAYIVERSVVLDVLHEAARRSDGRWPVEMGLARFAKPPAHYAAISRGTRALARECEMRAAEADGKGAARSILAIRRLAAALGEDVLAVRAIASDPRLHEVCVSTACSAAETALSLTEMSAQDLAMLRREFLAEIRKRNLQTPARAERAWLLWLITEAPTPKRHDYIDAIMAALPGVAESDAVRGLRYITEWIATFDLPPREQLRQTYALSGKWGDDERRRLFCSPSSVFWVASNIEWATERLLRSKQNLHVARAALAVEQFRMERGGWPEKLVDLVPEYLDAVPQDWFAPAGATISYLRTPTGVRLWSHVGRNSYGLAGDEWRVLSGLAGKINMFSGMPKSLAELVPEYYDSVPIDPRTNKPFTYVTNPANPELFIIGGYTGDKTEDEFWKATGRSTADWTFMHPSGSYGWVVFRLLNPELRGARQARFGDEVSPGFTAESLNSLGYTIKRLKELGFSDEDLEYYKKELKELGLEEESD